MYLGTFLNDCITSTTFYQCSHRCTGIVVIFTYLVKDMNSGVDGSVLLGAYSTQLRPKQAECLVLSCDSLPETSCVISLQNNSKVVCLYFVTSHSL